MTSMKKLLLTLVSFVAVLSARADLHADLDVILTTLDSQNTTYTGTFNITNTYNPLTHQIVWAGFEFSFIDLSRRDSESFSVTLGTDGTLVGSGGSFFPAALVINELTPWSFPTALQDLSDDGILQYTVVATSGSFILKSAGILAQSECRPVDVPDTGTTAALLGVGLLGLVALRRKVAA